MRNKASIDVSDDPEDPRNADEDKTGDGVPGSRLVFREEDVEGEEKATGKEGNE